MNKTYRVFLARHYIAVDWYDIEATSPKVARKAAKKAARKHMSDARREAVDNGWIPEEPVEIEYPGFSAHPFQVIEVFRDKDTIVYSRKEES